MNNLVLHIDDIGLSKSTNSAVFKLNNKGLKFSGSLMPNKEGFQDFISKYDDINKQMDIGVHITLTSEWNNSKTKPISNLDKIESLVDKNGLFFKKLQDTDSFDRQHLEIEIKAQIEFILDHGVQLSHIDSHMGVLLYKKHIDLYLKIARKYGLNAFCSYPKYYFKEWYWFYGAENCIRQYELDGGVVLGDFDSDSLCDINNYTNLKTYEGSLKKRLSLLKRNTSITISHVLDPSFCEDNNNIEDKHMRYIEYKYLLSGKFERLIKQLGCNLVKINEL